MEHKRFRAGYDFLLLREDIGEIESGLGHWWTIFQEASEEKQQEMVSNLQPSGNRSGNKNRRRRKPNKPKASSHD
jgi:poly(A) polymerase